MIAVNTFQGFVNLISISNQSTSFSSLVLLIHSESLIFLRTKSSIFYTSSQFLVLCSYIGKEFVRGKWMLYIIVNENIKKYATFIFKRIKSEQFTLPF